MVKKKLIAVIPARGGSKRIPRKNIVNFNGKPLIEWTIAAAIEFGNFDRIIVSTDSPEIAEVAVTCGAEVPFLRNEKADDVASVSEATIFTLKQMQIAGDDFDEVVQLMPVCPLRTARDIKEAYDHFEARKIEFQISCFKYAWMNPWWAATLDHQNRPKWIFENMRKNSQELPPLYCPTGAIWIAQIPALFRDKTFYGEGHVFFEMDWKRAVDIDTEEDITLAHQFAAMMKTDRQNGKN